MPDERPDHDVVRVHIELRRERFVNRRMLRHFRGEVILAAGYAVITVVLVIYGLPWPTLLLNLIVLAFLATTIYRAVCSYRQGFQDGLAAYPLSMMQPDVDAVVYLLEHSDEIWKPHPRDVAHDMEITRLEKDANGGFPSA